MVMKVLLVLLLIGLAVCLFFAYLSMTARAPESGLLEGRLRSCPEKPNCVCSEPETQASHRVQPLRFSGSSTRAWLKLQQKLSAMGGIVVAEQPGYLHVEFRSRIFRFVDDLELRLQEQDGLIHVRSASRVGYSDFGVNRKRVDKLRTIVEEPLI